MDNSTNGLSIMTSQSLYLLKCKYEAEIRELKRQVFDLKKHNVELIQKVKFYKQFSNVEQDKFGRVVPR